MLLREVRAVQAVAPDPSGPRIDAAIAADLAARGLTGQSSFRAWVRGLTREGPDGVQEWDGFGPGYWLKPPRCFIRRFTLYLEPEDRFLPRVLVEEEEFDSTSEVKRARPDLWIELPALPEPFAILLLNSRYPTHRLLCFFPASELPDPRQTVGARFPTDMAEMWIPPAPG